MKWETRNKKLHGPKNTNVVFLKGFPFHFVERREINCKFENEKIFKLIIINT